MKTPILIFVYVASIAAANLSVAAFGPSVTAINAFVLIGLDLTLRDWFHVRLSRSAMVALIFASGGASFALNPAAGVIAVASMLAFVLSAFADAAAFQLLRGSWFRRANGSNIVGAAVDSFVFPLVAFGGVLPEIVAGQFVAKVAGGFVWAVALRRVLGVAR